MNERQTGNTNRVPKTIDELKEWYMARNLPPEETTRFFIGKDIKEPRAFGIYKDPGGNFIVYKNKANGERAVRYTGPNEAHAVKEIYDKLKQEISNRKSGKTSGRSSKMSRALKKGGRIGATIYGIISVAYNLFTYVFAIIVLISFLMSLILPHKTYNGYYNHQGHTYYRYNADNWYVYDAVLDIWDYIDYHAVPSVMIDDPDQYYEGEKWNSDMNVSDFKTSDYYEELKNSNSDNDWSNDSDYNWDSGDSWDSGDTDWGSDW